MKVVKLKLDCNLTGLNKLCDRKTPFFVGH